MFSVVKAFPQPLRGLYVAFLVSFGIFFMSLMWQTKATWPLVPLGVTAFLTGLCLTTNYNKTADVVAEIPKQFRKKGVEYRKPPLANPVYLRVFGVVPMVFGALFTVAGFS